MTRKRFKLAVVLLLVTFALVAANNSESDPILELDTEHSIKQNKPISPGDISEALTDEPDEDPRYWRELGKDESVPPGSHVRMNLSTERKYVKRDLEAEAAAHDRYLEAQKLEQQEESNRLETLERVLYSLPDVDPRLPDIEARKRMTPEEYEAALFKVWAIRQEEIKTAMEQMADEPKMLANMTLILLNASLDSDDVELVSTLADLEWLVQDIDHALHFGGLGGVDLCVKLMGHNNTNVRQLAAHVAGNTVKNDPGLQSVALKAGLIPRALNRLKAILPCSDGGSQGDRSECAKMLYAISSTVRGFPEGQLEANAGGLHDMLDELVYSSDVDSRVEVKALALIADSMNEWDTCRSEESTSSLCIHLNKRAGELISGQNKLSQNVDAQQVALKLLDAARATSCQLAEIEQLSIRMKQTEDRLNDDDDIQDKN